MLQPRLLTNICKKGEGTALDLMRLVDAVLFSIGAFFLVLIYECTVVPIALTHFALIPLLFIVGVLIRMPHTVLVRSGDEGHVYIPLYRLKLSGLLCLLTAPFFVWHRQVPEEPYFTFMGGITLLAALCLLIEMLHIYRTYLRYSEKSRWATYAGWIQLATWYFVFVPIAVVEGFVFFNVITGTNNLSFILVIRKFPLILKLFALITLIGAGVIFWLSKDVLYRNLANNGNAEDVNR